ncbi:MAG TPA: hypothetical protein VE968_09350 [Sphingomicrobium sp.]|nr:hypothetical protein [Sphingomicrobium sp.]
MNDKPIVYDDPSVVRAIDGCVHMEGPDDVDVLLSPDAAEETSDRLLAESLNARGQRRLQRYPHQPKK